MSEREIERLWCLIDKRNGVTANLTVAERREYDALVEKYDRVESSHHQWTYSPAN